MTIKVLEHWPLVEVLLVLPAQYIGASTLSITTLSMMTFFIVIKNAKHIITALSITIKIVIFRITILSA